MDQFAKVPFDKVLSIHFEIEGGTAENKYKVVTF